MGAFCSGRSVRCQGGCANETPRKGLWRIRPSSGYTEEGELVRKGKGSQAHLKDKPRPPGVYSGLTTQNVGRGSFSPQNQDWKGEIWRGGEGESARGKRGTRVKTIAGIQRGKEWITWTSALTKGKFLEGGKKRRNNCDLLAPHFSRCKLT